MLIVLAFGPVPALAGPGYVSPEDAYAQAQRGDLTIVDVRSPGEWHKTGIPKGAAAITIHDPRGPAGFLDSVLKMVDGDRQRPLAMICASGTRSAAATAYLRSQGFTNVYDIHVGMLGRDGSPGWIARDLPLQPCPDCR